MRYYIHIFTVLLACESRLVMQFYKSNATSAIVCSYGTVQFKLDRTCVQHELNTTCFSFHTHARWMTSNLLCKPLVYTLDMCMNHACMSGMHTPNLDYACMQIVSQGQWNKLYKHVHVLRC